MQRIEQPHASTDICICMYLLPLPQAPQELDAALAAAAPMAGIEQLRHADSAPPGCLPSAPSPAALPAVLAAQPHFAEHLFAKHLPCGGCAGALPAESHAKGLRCV